MQGGNDIAKTSVSKQEKIKQTREHINNHDRRADGVRPPAGAPVRHDRRARCGAAGGGGGAWHRGGSGRAAGVQRGACPLMVQVDAAQIGEALRVLVQNALEAVEKGKFSRKEITMEGK